MQIGFIPLQISVLMRKKEKKTLLNCPKEKPR